MTEYRVVGERMDDVLEPVEYSFYEGREKVAIFTDLSWDLFPKDRNFLIKVARKQEQIFNGNKKIKSMETKFKIE